MTFWRLFLGYGIKIKAKTEKGHMFLAERKSRITRKLGIKALYVVTSLSSPFDIIEDFIVIGSTLDPHQEISSHWILTKKSEFTNTI